MSVVKNRFIALLFLSLSVLFIFFLPSTCYSDIYSWKDEKGVEHFTNSINSIPRQHRKRSKLIKRTKPKVGPFKTETKGEDLKGKEKKTSGLENQKTVVSLRQSGNSFIVSATLNGSYEALFVLDTGASITTISKDAAAKLRIKITPDTPVLSLQTANGIIDAPLIKLKSISVGGRKEKDMMAVVLDVEPGFTGLLGLTFLNEFNYSVNPNDQVLILDSLEDPDTEKLYGGHGQKWWKQKFYMLRSYVDGEKKIIEKLERMKSKTEDKKRLLWIEDRIEIKNNNVKFFKKELKNLKTKATIAMVPGRWKQ